MKKYTIALLCGAFFMHSLVACDGASSDRGNLRDNRSRNGSADRDSNDPNKPSDGELKTYSPEAVGGLLLVSFAELHRTTDFVMNGAKAKSLHKDQRLEVDKKSSTINLISTSTLWKGVEKFSVAHNDKKQIQTAELQRQAVKTELKTNTRTIKIEKHINSWTLTGPNQYSYKQVIEIAMEPKSKGENSIAAEIENEGTLILDGKTQEITGVQPTKLQVTYAFMNRNGMNLATTSLSATLDGTAKDMVCGRPIAEWSVKQTLRNDRQGDFDDKEFKLESDLAKIKIAGSSRSIPLAKCTPGFSMFIQDIETIAERFEAHLGR